VRGEVSRRGGTLVALHPLVFYRLSKTITGEGGGKKEGRKERKNGELKFRIPRGEKGKRGNPQSKLREMGILPQRLVIDLSHQFSKKRKKKKRGERTT